MSWLHSLVVVIQILAALAMIGLVLVQHGKGADMGASFGSGASGSLFGATGSANFLSRSTAVCAGLFFICTLSLAFLSSNTVRSTGGTGSVLDRAPVSAPAPAASSNVPQIPTGVAPAGGASAAAGATPAAAASAAPAIPTR
jgi:preprotein translocase subunit SecG